MINASSDIQSEMCAPSPPPPHPVLDALLDALSQAASVAAQPPPRLLAASKAQSAAAIAALAHAWQPRLPQGARPVFGENYVQEALAKRHALPDLQAEWHLIGHLQSNKAREAAHLFDWVQTIDRPQLITALAQHRRAEQPPLELLIQVNIDDEASKHGCRPDDIESLAAAIAMQPRLRLRGLMAIPAPVADLERRRDAFRRMRGLFDALVARHPTADTLSMGMSDDYALAIAEGATMVRIGSALFGARPAPSRSEIST